MNAGSSAKASPANPAPSSATLPAPSMKCRRVTKAIQLYPETEPLLGRPDFYVGRPSLRRWHDKFVFETRIIIGVFQTHPEGFGNGGNSEEVQQGLLQLSGGIRPGGFKASNPRCVARLPNNCRIYRHKTHLTHSNATTLATLPKLVAQYAAFALNLREAGAFGSVPSGDGAGDARTGQGANYDLQHRGNGNGLAILGVAADDLHTRRQAIGVLHDRRHTSRLNVALAALDQFVAFSRQFRAARLQRLMRAV